MKPNRLVYLAVNKPSQSHQASKRTPTAAEIKRRGEAHRQAFTNSTKLEDVGEYVFSGTKRKDFLTDRGKLTAFSEKLFKCVGLYLKRKLAEFKRNSFALSFKHDERLVIERDNKEIRLIYSKGVSSKKDTWRFSLDGSFLGRTITQLVSRGENGRVVDIFDSISTGSVILEKERGKQPFSDLFETFFTKWKRSLLEDKIKLTASSTNARHSLSETEKIGWRIE